MNSPTTDSPTPVDDRRLPARARDLVGRLTGGLTANSFARSVLVLLAGGALGQVIGVAASPIITRLYPPHDFGILAVYTSILSLLSVGASLRFEQAIPMPEHDEDGRHLLAIALSANVTLGLITLVAVGIFGDRMAEWTNAPGLMPWLWLLPLSVTALGAFEALSFWAVRIREFSLIATGKVTQNASQVTAQITFGLLGFGSAGLLAGDAGSRLLAVAQIARLLSRRAGLLAGISRARMRAMAVAYRRFAMVSTASGLVNSAVVNLPNLILAALYGPAAAGYFALGRLVVFAPFGVLGQSIQRVYLSRVTRARYEAPWTMMGLLSKVSLRLSLALPVFALIMVLAPDFFRILFGPTWREVGHYTQILVPALALDFILQTTSVLVPLGFVWHMLVWDVWRTVTALGGIMLAHALGHDARTAILVYSMAMCFSYILLFLANVRVIRRHFPQHEPAGAS